MSKASEPVPVLDLPEGVAWGPAMSALPNDRMRAFVLAMIEPGPDGIPNFRRAAMRAGYTMNKDSAGVQGSRLAADPRIQAAMLEEGIRSVGAAIPVAVATVINIMENGTPSDKLKAARMILNRGGIPERTEHHVTTEVIESEAQKLERAIRIAKQLGLDAGEIFGRAGLPFPGQLEPPRAPPTETYAEFEQVGTTDGLEDFLGSAPEPAAEDATPVSSTSVASGSPGVAFQDDPEAPREP